MGVMVQRDINSQCLYLHDVIEDVVLLEEKEEPSTRRTLHADVNTRKGANGELFIDSIPDSVEKINPTGENSEKISRSVSPRIVFGTPANTVGVKERVKGAPLRKAVRPFQLMIGHVSAFPCIHSNNKKR